jgi:general secretion pathway protein H
MMRAAPDNERNEASGFTLVELMVVLVILGLASAAVILTLPERGGSLVAEAERFAARTKAARDNAILDSRTASVAIGPGGYDVTRRSEAAHYDWVAGTQPALSGGREGRIRFGATGLADPAQVVLRRGGRLVAIDIGEDGNVRIRR